MSSSKQLIINCGATHVTASVLSQHGSSLQVDKLVSVDLDYDYSNDESWIDAVGQALQDLNNIHKFSGKASFIIPGNQLLTKTIRIPHVEDAKRAQIIAFEAQQNIPYPLHEVVWDSQVVGDDGVETEVLFIACKSTTISDFTDQVSGAGLVAESISAATVLDYNALNFANADLEDDVLLINIGARSTNLLFKNADGFFVRNIQLGGNSLTQSIADSLGKSFTQAEEVKLKFFGGSMDYSEDDSGAKLLTSSADAFIRRMGQEITRSIVNYRRQKSGAAPKRILLSGRGALLPGLSEQLATSQKVPVEFFDALENVTLDGAIDSDPNLLRLQISETIGEASRPILSDAAGVNLLPEEIQAAMRFASKKPFLVIAAACLALAPWPAFLALQKQADAYEAQRQSIQSQLAPLQGRQGAILENAETAKALSDSIARVEGLVNSKANWTKFLAELQTSLYGAKDVWLEQLKVQRGNKNGEQSYEVIVEGQMLVRETANGSTSNVDRDALTRRIKSLQENFEGSEFIVSSRPPSIDWSKLRDGLNLLPFTINLVVDTAKPL